MNEMNNTPAIVSADEFHEIKENGLMVSATDLANPPASAMYCSMTGETQADKIKVFNAINSPDARVSDFIGKTIELVHVVAHPITLTDENTGEMIEALRVVLVDKNGKSYEAVSGGIANAVQRILQIFGQPDTWENPIKVEPVSKATRNGTNKVTTLKIVG